MDGVVAGKPVLDVLLLGWSSFARCLTDREPVLLAVGCVKYLTNIRVKDFSSSAGAAPALCGRGTEMLVTGHFDPLYI